MHDGTVSIGKTIAAVLWLLATVMVLGAWALAFTGRPHAGLLLGQTACVVTGIAMVRHLRCYHVRTAAIVRAGFQLDELPPAEIRSIPRQPVR